MDYIFTLCVRSTVITMSKYRALLLILHLPISYSLLSKCLSVDSIFSFDPLLSLHNFVQGGHLLPEPFLPNVARCKNEGKKEGVLYGPRPLPVVDASCGCKPKRPKIIRLDHFMVAQNATGPGGILFPSPKKTRPAILRAMRAPRRGVNLNVIILHVFTIVSDSNRWPTYLAMLESWAAHAARVGVLKYVLLAGLTVEDCESVKHVAPCLVSSAFTVRPRTRRKNFTAIFSTLKIISVCFHFRGSKERKLSTLSIT